MQIDLARESLLTLSAAATMLPGRPHISTMHRWRLRGVRGVRLETILVGGRRYTSWQALERFAASITSTAETVARGSDQRRHPRSDWEQESRRAVHDQAARAEAALRAEGI